MDRELRRFDLEFVMCRARLMNGARVAPVRHATAESHMSHIHCGRTGENGPIRMWLYPTIGPTGAPTPFAPD